MIKRLILFVIGIALALFVIHMFGFDQTVTALSHARIEYVILAIILQLVIQSLLAGRLLVIAYGKGKLSFKDAFLTTQSGTFVSLVTPIAKVGGEPLKIYMLKKFFGTSRASAVVAVDSFVEVISSVLAVLFAVMFFAPSLTAHLFFIFAMFFIASFLVIGFVLKIMLTPKWLNKIVKWATKQISKFQHVDEKDYATLFQKAFTLLLRDKKLIAASFGISFLTKILEFVRIWLIFMALGAFVPINTIIIVWSIIIVLLMIPWLPGSLGLVELGGVSTYVLFNIPAAVAASSVVLDRLVAFWLVLFIGALCIYISKKNGLIPKFNTKKDITEIGTVPVKDKNTHT